MFTPPFPMGFKPPIRKKPWWLDFSHNHGAYTTAFGTIYCDSNEVVRRLENPQTAIDRAHLVHESVHAWRQQEHGAWAWSWNYLVHKSFRWREEKLAYETEFAFLRQFGRLDVFYSQPKLVEVLCGSLYQGMISRAEAQAFLDAEWRK